MAMNEAQLTRFLAALPRQYKKPSVFSTGDGAEWRTWRRNFMTIQVMQAWEDQRARREAASAMEGNAARVVQDIPVDGDNNALGIAAFLDLYEARFLPAAAGQLSRVDFRVATQQPDETILAWHTRLREVFTRAFPQGNAHNDQHLIEKFVLGMADANVVSYTYDHHPETYGAALVHAQNKAATQAVIAGRSSAGIQSLSAATSAKATNAIGGQQGGPDGCWYCGDKSHVRKDCKLFEKQKVYFMKYFQLGGRYRQGNHDPGGGHTGQGNFNRGRGGGRGGGGRGRGGRGNNNNRRGNRGGGYNRSSFNHVDAEQDYGDYDSAAPFLLTGECAENQPAQAEN